MYDPSFVRLGDGRPCSRASYDSCGYKVWGYRDFKSRQKGVEVLRCMQKRIEVRARISWSAYLQIGAQGACLLAARTSCAGGVGGGASSAHFASLPDRQSLIVGIII